MCVRRTNGQKGTSTGTHTRGVFVCAHAPRRLRFAFGRCLLSFVSLPQKDSLGMRTDEEAETLRAIGAHLLQGYLFGRPSLQLPDESLRQAC